MKNIPIVTCVDNSYIQHGTVMLLSLLHNIRTEKTYIIYFFHSGCSRDLLEKTRETLSNSKPYNVTIKYIEIPNGLRPDFYVKKDYLNEGIFDKLIIFDLLPNSIDRILFLDSDILILSDIYELYSTSLHGRVLAAVKDHYEKFNEELKTALGLPSVDSYFNSGVMVIDLPKFKKGMYSKKAIEFLIKHEKITVCYDQDGFNFAIAGNWLRLDKRWNPRPYNEIEDIKGRTVHLLKNEVYRKNLAYLVHFSGSDKPWFYTSNHPMKKMYWKYLKQTEFRDYKYPDKTFRNALTKMKDFIKWELIYAKREVLRRLKGIRI